MALTIGLLAGEASGDNLGAGLMAQLEQQYLASDPAASIRFIGVGGPRMQAAGLQNLASMDELAVNGFREPILRLPQLVRLLRRLIREFTAAEVDAFVGVDFNVFNFLLEGALKKRGIRTVHYVSPSVYAWRSGRTKRVAKCADLLLCLYPFEPDFYTGLPVRAEFIGHPLADEIDPRAGTDEARAAARAGLGVSEAHTVMALLPGSRSSEVALMIEPFLDAADIFSTRHAPVDIVIPCLRPHIRERVERAVAQHPTLEVTLYDGNARQALVAADVALVKSGTSTLEAMLLHRPMVVSYRLGGLSYQLAKRVVRTPHVALPNILAGDALVPELIQDAATGPALAAALSEQLQRARRDSTVVDTFLELHERLRQGADTKAAAAVLRLLRDQI
jgi:lipid-A-disaccharide synthase